MLGPGCLQWPRWPHRVVQCADASPGPSRSSRPEAGPAESGVALPESGHWLLCLQWRNQILSPLEVEVMVRLLGFQWVLNLLSAALASDGVHMPCTGVPSPVSSCPGMTLDKPVLGSSSLDFVNKMKVSLLNAS